MKKLLLVMAVAAVCTSWAVAQSDQDTKGKGDTRTVTGCLSKGDSAKEFVLTEADGSTWEVRSSTVQLGEHVGHQVSATGVVSHAKMHNMKEDAKDMAQDSGMKKDNTEHGHMKVTDVKMVSDSCK
jgi:hypothetical protein